MLKKALLASITAITLSPTSAAQAQHPVGAPHQGGQPHAGPHVVGHKEIDCPPGYRKVIKIIDGTETTVYELDGTVLIHSGHGTGEHTTTHTTHHGGDLHTKPGSKLDITDEMKEQENLRKELELHGIASLYTRNGKSESGKEYSGDKYPHGVYFFETSEVDSTGKMKALKVPGWKLDPTVKPKGLKPRGKTTAGQKAAAEKLSKQKQKPVAGAVKVDKPGPVPPGAVGLTVRTNTAKTQAPAPTSITLPPQAAGQLELQQGRANVAQTGITGGEAPKIDTSETMAAVPPPPPPPPPPAKVPGLKAPEPTATPAG